MTFFNEWKNSTGKFQSLKYIDIDLNEATNKNCIKYRQGNEAARPNVVAYNSVLNACAYSPNDAGAIETAFKIACLVFDEVRTSCHVTPTHVTYGTFLSVCANLMPESEVRDNLVEATFKRCAREGLVSNMVWRNLNAAASPTLLAELLEQANSGLESSWSRNV